jgi:nucleotide-binding universal stress UspA family protein/mannose-6-phosphate isomerase-like protein (cupin superfamily)
MSIHSVSTSTAKETGRTNTSLRKVVSTGEYAALVAVTIPPGKEAGEETHDNSDQALFIVEGRGEAILNGHAEPAGEHDAVFIPAGTAHNIKNSGVEDLKMFVVYSPPLDADAAAAARTWGAKNSYAIARSVSLVYEPSEAEMRPFPGSIKWSSWRSTKLENVLFATDFSAASETALPYTVSIARRFHSNLLLTHVVNTDGYGLIGPEAVAQVLTGVKEVATLKIAGLMRSNHGEDLRYQAIVKEGVIDDTLLGIVEHEGIDLVVLGTHGRRGLDQLMLGSVAEKVFRLARCPVLTVGPNVPPLPSETAPFKHVLYPMELSVDVPDAAALARTIAKAYDAQLTFLNVIEHSFAAPDERAWLNVTAEHWFEDRVAPNLGLGKNAHFVQTFGNPATAIVRYARETSADLIVMNVHGAHPRLAGRLPGVAYRVVIEAPCPVLTVR